MSTCKGCGRKVIFAKDENGTTQILDAVAPVYSVLEIGPPKGVGQSETRCVRSRTTYVSHFVTCSKREQFKKPAKQPPLDLGGANI